MSLGSSGRTSDLMARILALDVGSKRVGVACSDELAIIAIPLGTLRRASYNRDAALIAALVAEKAAECVVVGLPTSLSGQASAQTRRIEQFAEMLATRISVPVVLWDERLTTVMAKAINASDLDAVAAAFILQNYLDARARMERDPAEPPASDFGLGR